MKGDRERLKDQVNLKTPAEWKSLLMNCHGVMLSDVEKIYST